MQRTVLLAAVAAVVVVGSIATSVALPRFGCSATTRLIETSTEPPECRETHPVMTPGSYVPSDRSWVKIGIATSGTVLGGAIAAFAFVRRRPSGRSLQLN